MAEVTEKYEVYEPLLDSPEKAIKDLVRQLNEQLLRMAQSIEDKQALGDAVTPDDGSVTTAKLAANAVTPAKTSHGFVSIINIPSGVKEYSDGSGSEVEVGEFRILIPEGATAITGEARIKCNSNDTIDCTININGDEIAAVRNADSYSWVAFSSSIDASALTSGTTYDVSIRLDSRDSSRTAYLDGLSLWWE